MSNKQQAILLMLLSTLSFSVMQLIVKLSSGDIPTMEQVFARNFVTLIFGFVMARRVKAPLCGHSGSRLLLLGRAVCGYIGVAGYFYATTNMNVADASLLHRSSPFFVMLFSAMFLKNRLGWKQITALLLAFGGAVLVIDPSFRSDLLPAAAGLASAAGAGAAYVIINALRGRENNATIIFAFSAVSCLLSVVFGFGSFIMPSGSDWLMLAGIGVFAGAGQVLLTSAYKMTEPGEVSIINYTGILFSALFGTVFLNETLGVRSICGMALIFSAALVVYFAKESRNKPANNNTVSGGEK